MFRTATNCDVNLCFDSIVRPELDFCINIQDINDNFYCGSN